MRFNLTLLRASLFLISTAVSGLILGQEPRVPDAVPVPNVTTDPGLLATVVERLSVESRKDFAELLKQDWKNPPEWVQMLIPMLLQQDIGPGQGWYRPSQTKYDWNWIAARFDSTKDGTISAEEFAGSGSAADSIFGRLDVDGDGVLRPTDFDHFSRQPLTPPQMMSQALSFLVDADSNGRITPEELNAFLKRADRDEAGFMTSEDLFIQFSQAFMQRNSGGSDMPGPDEMLAMFFRGEIGLWEEGPKIGDDAPDFTLPTHDGKQKITLSNSRGKPVVLIFGSFT